MSYALVHYPNINIELINKIRQKYDPQFHLIAPHITLVFPIKPVVNQDNLMNHIENVLRRWKAFPIHLKGLDKSWDNYLFLMLNQGKVNMIELHKGLYTDILAEYCRQDIPFVPHITLGVFNLNVDKYLQALQEAQRLDLDYQCVVDKLHLININDQKKQIVSVKDYVLSS